MVRRLFCSVCRCLVVVAACFLWIAALERFCCRNLQNGFPGSLRFICFASLSVKTHCLLFCVNGSICLYYKSFARFWLSLFYILVNDSLLCLCFGYFNVPWQSANLSCIFFGRFLLSKLFTLKILFGIMICRLIIIVTIPVLRF